MLQSKRETHFFILNEEVKDFYIYENTLSVVLK